VSEEWGTTHWHILLFLSHGSRILRQLTLVSPCSTVPNSTACIAPLQAH